MLLLQPEPYFRKSPSEGVSIISKLGRTSMGRPKCKTWLPLQPEQILKRALQQMPNSFGCPTCQNRAPAAARATFQKKLCGKSSAALHIRYVKIVLWLQREAGFQENPSGSVKIRQLKKLLPLHRETYSQDFREGRSCHGGSPKAAPAAVGDVFWAEATAPRASYRPALVPQAWLGLIH